MQGRWSVTLMRALGSVALLAHGMYAVRHHPAISVPRLLSEYLPEAVIVDMAAFIRPTQYVATQRSPRMTIFDVATNTPPKFRSAFFHSFLPDGERVATKADSGGVTQILNAHTGRVLHRLSCAPIDDEDSPLIFVTSTDDRILMLCEEGERAVIWNTSSGRRLRDFRWPQPVAGEVEDARYGMIPGWIDGARLSADGIQVVTWFAEQTVIVRNVHSGEVVWVFAALRDTFVSDIMLFPDGQRLAMHIGRRWEVGDKLEIWNMSSSAMVAEMVNGNGRVKAVFSRDCTLLALMSYTEALRSEGHGTEVAQHLDLFRVRSGGFSPIPLWVGAPQRRDLGSDAEVRFSSDGRRMLVLGIADDVAGPGFPVRLTTFDTDSGRRLRSANLAFGGGDRRGVLWSVEGGVVALCGHGRTTALDAETLRVLRVVEDAGDCNRIQVGLAVPDAWTPARRAAAAGRARDKGRAHVLAHVVVRMRMRRLC